MLNGFKQFILRGNVVELAVGVVIGASFNSVINSLVKDLITPLISVIARIPDLSNLVLSIGDNKFLYGNFINNTISFFVIALSVYFVFIVPMNLINARFSKKEDIVKDKNCSECLSSIPKEARKCKFCGEKQSV